MTDYERFGDYQASDRSTFGTAITFLCIGLGVGSLIALLLAPQSGRKTRNLLRRRYEDAFDAVSEKAESLRDRAGEWRDRGAEYADSAREWTENAKEKVRPLGRAFKK
ncbi:MAG: YtxH domain-containing protein [Terriglobales bacterium]|jgi:gas vesicle protein